jgi:two-component system sensor histidine kinase PilS (NtrC family)
MPDREIERANEPLATASHRAQMRRISYFMLFRLGMLAVFTVLAGAIAIAGDPGLGPQSLFVWAALVGGYGLTILYARMLPRVRDLGWFAAMQTAIDIAMSLFAVQITGGIESGMASLYLISVLGAATMGGKRLTWAAAATSASVYAIISALEIGGALEPMSFTEEHVPLPLRDSLAIVVRTLAALTGVAFLSSFLNTQLQTSVSQVGNLRALNENIVRSLTSGLITTDRDDRLLYFNPSARQILELADADIGRSLADILPDLPLAPRRSRDGRVDVRHRLPGGQQIHVGLSRSPLRDAQGSAVGHVIHFQDVTRLHELAERVRRNERLAALGGMAASVAHEIRNPLAAISGSAELLSSAELGDEDRRLLEIIRRESTRLSDMVRDLLAFTRPREPVLVRVELDTSVRATAESFAADPANAGITMVFDGAPGVEVDVDPSQLGQVLWNLMRNAAEALDGQGTIHVAVNAENDDACIEVTDHGKGIEAERIEHIFDPFFTTKEHGTGFGLAIVHRIVHDNGGTIRVRSTVGVGSTFTIVFPRTKDAVETSSSGELSID